MNHIIIAGLIISIMCFFALNQNSTPENIVNNTTANTTVVHVNSDDSSNNVQKDDSAGQINDNNNMPEETRKIYAARQKSAEDEIPMYE